MKPFDFDDAIHTIYAGGRGLDPDVLRMWMDAVSSLASSHRITRILDLGAGTGRFSVLLAEEFDAVTFAVDRSRKMLASVPISVPSTVANAESLPIRDQTIDLVFASMVLHHITDLTRTAMEVRRVLCPDGLFMVRTCFPETLDVPYHQFFPSIVDIERRMLPSRSEVVDTFGRGGLVLVNQVRLRQRMNQSYRSYAERMRQRAMSTLRMISDAEFTEGMRALDVVAQAETEPQPVFEHIDLLQFRRSP